MIPKRKIVYMSIVDVDEAELKRRVDKIVEAMPRWMFPNHTSNPCAEIELPYGDDPIPFDSQLEQMCKDHDDYFWPHKNACPLCGSDAYVGASVVECSMSSCQNFFYRPGM